VTKNVTTSSNKDVFGDIGRLEKSSVYTSDHALHNVAITINSYLNKDSKSTSEIL
jgi:hypothetical protein